MIGFHPNLHSHPHFIWHFFSLIWFC